MSIDNTLEQPPIDLDSVQSRDSWIFDICLLQPKGSQPVVKPPEPFKILHQRTAWLLQAKATTSGCD